MIFLYSIFESFWRRAFGSGNFNRGILHLINILVTIFVLRYVDISWIKVLFVVPIFEFIFWSLGHGGAFDIGRAGYPDEETIKRYERFFWDKWCKIIIPKKYWYGMWYDYMWMLFRYGLPAILISLILGNVLFSVAGFGVATSYAICWNLYDESKLKRLSATEWAELLSGFIVGFLIMC